MRPNGRPLPFAGMTPPGATPITLEPANANLTLVRVDHPEAGPCVLLTLEAVGWPLLLRIPIPVLAWAKLVSDIGVSSEAG